MRNNSIINLHDIMKLKKLIKCLLYTIISMVMVNDISCETNITYKSRKNPNLLDEFLNTNKISKQVARKSNANIDLETANKNDIFDKRISEIKCEEYRNMIMQDIPVIHLTSLKTIFVTRRSCEPPINYLISNGEAAEYQEFPHMAAIGWKENNTISYLCGGSLISNNWILTAAHCTHTHLGKPTIVKLGSNSLYDNMGKIIEIIDIICHPAYNRPQMYFDIALLKLVKPVNFDSNIHPACLYSQFETTPLVVWATGWGSKQYDEKNFSAVLMKVKLHIIDNIQCSIAYNYSSIIPYGVVPSMVCAGDPYGKWKKDTCLGDSGGPLQIFNPDNCLYHVVGLTSFGKLCMMINTPGVYTRISHYLDWIESIVWS